MVKKMYTKESNQLTEDSCRQREGPDRRGLCSPAGDGRPMMQSLLLVSDVCGRAGGGAAASSFFMCVLVVVLGRKVEMPECPTVFW